MNRQEVNFEDLLGFYYFKTQAAVTAKRIYEESRVVSSVNEMISGARDLARCYSVMEIAALAALIPAPDKSTFWQQAHAILESTFAATFLTEWLEQPLMRLFKSRMRGVEIALHEESDDITDSVLNFLDLDRRYILADGDSHFAVLTSDLLNPRFRALMQACNKPSSFAEQLLCAPEERDLGGEQLYGLSWLFGFCFELNSLLNQLSRVPVLQAAIWGHYHYWLGQKAKRFQHNVFLVQGLFESWSKHLDTEAEGAIVSYNNQLWQAVEELTSDKYAQLLERISTNASKLSGEKAAPQHSIGLEAFESASDLGLIDEKWKLQTQGEGEFLGAGA